MTQPKANSLPTRPVGSFHSKFSETPFADGMSSRRRVVTRLIDEELRVLLERAPAPSSLPTAELLHVAWQHGQLLRFPTPVKADMEVIDV